MEKMKEEQIKIALRLNKGALKQVDDLKRDFELLDSRNDLLNKVIDIGVKKLKIVLIAKEALVETRERVSVAKKDNKKGDNNESTI